METLSNWFWNERIWLPENYTWNDFQSNDQVRYTEFRDLVYPIFIGIGLIFIRFPTERYFLEKWGVRLGLRHQRNHILPKANPKLQTAYDRMVAANGKRKLGFRDVEKLAKECGLEVRQVQRWMRRVLNSNRPTRLNKFAESGWRFICYTALWIGGVVVLLDKPWFWDMKECWHGYPFHPIENDVWWYYIMSTSFYWSLFLSHFTDTRRKDFWEMFVHHITTIGLLCFSWTCHLTRAGSLVILLHDTADFVLEAGKMAKYAHRDRLCDAIFVVFTLAWIITRLGVYPYHILSATLFEAVTIIKIFPAYYIFNAMLTLLFFLHIFWTYFIVKIALSAVSKGKYEDARSSTSSEEEDDRKNQ